MDKDKRTLTEKEQKRKERFEKLNSEMQQKGYQIKNMVIHIRQANYLGPLSMLPFMAFIFWVYYHVNGFDLEGISLGFAVVAFLSILCLTILHELIHGITWGIFAKNHFHSIDFGIIWNSFSPYCTCSELFFLSEFMILSGGGDFLITLKILLYRTNKKKSVYCDHPYECGFVVFEK